MVVLTTALFAAQSLRYAKLRDAAKVIKTVVDAAAKPTKKSRVQPTSIRSRAKFE